VILPSSAVKTGGFLGLTARHPNSRTFPGAVVAPARGSSAPEWHASSARNKVPTTRSWVAHGPAARVPVNRPVGAHGTARRVARSTAWARVWKGRQTKRGLEASSLAHPASTPGAGNKAGERAACVKREWRAVVGSSRPRSWGCTGPRCSPSRADGGRRALHL